MEKIYQPSCEVKNLRDAFNDNRRQSHQSHITKAKIRIQI